ncbi:MAG: hypothetical protein GY950_22250 [bacterium]|nr:hypothetical protein [bacterium]
MTADLLGFCIKWLTKIGHLAILAAAGLGFIFALIYVIRSNRFDAFLLGIIWVLIIFVLQYTATKFLPVGETLIKNNPTRLSSRAFLNCFAFIILLGGVIMLIMGIIDAIKYKALFPFLWGLGVFLLFEFVALVSFNPKEISIDVVENNSAGQEAIGIITFFIKTFMKLVPVFFGIGVLLGLVMLCIKAFGLFGDNFQQAWFFSKRISEQILFAILLPFLSYIFFALAYLVIDVIKAILSIPEKLDKK